MIESDFTHAQCYPQNLNICPCVTVTFMHNNFKNEKPGKEENCSFALNMFTHLSIEVEEIKGKHTHLNFDIRNTSILQSHGLY